MSDSPTILHVARLGSTFRFQITKPDQILAPIMEIWDVEARPGLLEKLCKQLSEIIEEHSQRSLTTQARERIINLGKALYRQLILPGPAGDRLQAVLSGDSSPLLISTDVPEIPWELLHDGKDFLGLKYAIGRQLLKSTGVPIVTPWRGDLMRCLLIADPRDNLPEARKEAETLKQWLAQQGIVCDLLLGGEANESEIVIRLSSDSYNFIHYSGHVDVDPETKTHGLVLSDQLLSSIAIERAISSNGPVVILNGCDTASSVEGLADAFLKSGAQLVVGSLFKVPDFGARRWAEVFYEGLISKQQAGEALRLARQATSSDPACSITWMAFVMYGNPCLQLIWGEEPKVYEGTLLDRVLRTMELGRQDFDNACLNVLESSLKYAGEAGGVGSAHLFTAMLEGPDSQLRDYLQAREVDPAEIRKGFERAFRFTELLTQTILLDVDVSVKLSDSVSHVLREACNRARQAKRSQATFDDLLFAFSQRRSGVSSVLQAMGIDLKEMVHSLGIEPLPGEAVRSPERQDYEPETSIIDLSPQMTQEAEQPFRTRGAKAISVESATTLAKHLRTEDIAEPEPYVVERFADVSFPSSIVKSRWYVLRIQICVTKHGEQDVTLEVEMPDKGQPAMVEMCVQAPGFEAVEALQRAIAVPPTGDSQTVEFHLRAERPGTYKIRVDFIQDHRYIGTTQLDVRVVGEETEIGSEGQGRKAEVVGQPAIGQVGVPPDLTILIAERPLATGEHQLKFMLLSPSIDLGLYYRDAGESILRSSPEKWVEHVLKQLPEIAQESDGEIVERRLKGIGNTLWDELIPETFKTIYWQVRENIHTVLIVTDDPWIPWEMIRPYRQTQHGVEEDDFLCQQFSLARWLRGTPTLSQIPVSESRVIGAGTDSSQRFVPLLSVDEEVSIVKSIMKRMGAHAVSLDPSRAELFRTLERGGFHHLHIACHGSAFPRGGDLSIIMLKDGNLAPLDIRGVVMTLGRGRPLVFLNACETGRLGASLTRLGGWAEGFIAAGCSAFVGTLWEVSDDSAQKFARIFYDEICRRTTLGEACRRARSGIRESDDPTWLAYCLYADPQAVLVLPDTPPPKLDEGDIVSKVLQYSFQRSLERQRAFIDSTQFFEALLEVGGQAGVQAFQRLGIPVQEIIDVFHQVNDSKPPSPQPPPSEEDVGISKSVAEILRLAECLARQSGHKQIRDIDLLEAFVLHGQNTTTQLLTQLELEPEILLNGAFQEDGALNAERFSETVKAMLTDMVRYAQHTRLVGSPQILAALVAQEDSLARKRLRVQGGDLDKYVHTRLSKAIVYANRPQPQVVSLETCSTRARRIFNLAELLARVEGALVEEEHLLRVYVQCTQPAE